jgi:hypothetical protein
MKTLIIHGSDISNERAKDILEKLCNVGGPLEFKLAETSDWPDGNSGPAPLESLFKVSRRFREMSGAAETDFVILLTDQSNERNFYATLDPGNTRNGFVHTGEWERFIHCDSNIPVAFTVLNLVILWHTSPDFHEMDATLHHKPIGCANDLCNDKRDVIFKLRTGDVCSKCIQKMQQNGWPDLRIDHALRILEYLSEKMRYKQFFKPVVMHSRMVIDMDEGTVSLPDHGNVQVQLSPIELAFYLLFLKRSNGNGLKMVDLSSPEIKSELMNNYQKLRPIRTKDELKYSVDSIGDILLSTRHERRTGVKKAFEAALGERLAKPYLITGKKGGYMKISLPMEKVEVKWVNWNVGNPL